MTEGDDDRDPSPGKPKAGNKTLMGLGNLPIPRPRAKTAFNAHPASTLTEESSEVELSLDALEPLSLEIEISADDIEPLSIEMDQEPQSIEFELEPQSIEIELSLDEMELQESSAVDEFGDEATQIGSMSAFREDAPEFQPLPQEVSAEHDGMFSNFEASPKASPSPFSPTEALPAPIYSSQAPVEAPEQEFDATKTEMLLSPYESESPVVKLHVLGGPATGQEYFVNDMRTTVGRGESNTAMIPDGAMSRQHFEIVKNPDESYTLYDLQSINGTGLNGTRVKEADLYQGDRIEAGKTIFQFLVHGQLPQPNRQRRLIPALANSTMSGGMFPPQDLRAGTVMANVGTTQGLMKLSTLITIVAGVMSAILLTGIIVILVSGNSPNQAENQALSSQKYLKGVDAVREHDWAKAEKLFLESHTLDENLDVSAQLKRIAMERQAKASFESARSKFDAQDFDEAAKLAALVPTVSVYHEDAQGFSRKPQALATDETLARAQERVTADDLSVARILTREILAKIPDHKGALDLQSHIDQLEEKRQREQQIAADRVKEAPKALKTSDSIDPFADLPESGSKSSRVVNFTEGFRLYKAGKFDAASAYFAQEAATASGASAERAKKTSKEIQEFAKLYEDAVATWKVGDWKKADKLLTQARRVDSAVAGGRGYFDADLASKVADARANRGLAAFESGDFADAYKWQRDAEKQDSKNDSVRTLRNKLLAEARSFYIKAVNARKSNPNEAAKLARSIMAMIPESEDTWKKAQKLVQEL